MTGKKKIKKESRFFNSLDVPAECFCDVPVIELHGDSYMLISGCKHIEEYGEETIGIRTGLGLLSVCGKNLTLLNFTCDKMVIEGKIQCVNLLEAKDNG